MKLDIVEKLAIVFIALCLALVAYATYGYLTQRETITIEVVDKRIEKKTTTSCSDKDRSGNCTEWTTTTSTNYIIVGLNETFSVSSDRLYGQMMVGKKYGVVAVGWKNTWIRRMITQIVEGV